MQYDNERVNPNIRGLVLALVAFAALLLYGLPALSSRNPLWFVRSLGTEASQIVVYRDGERLVLRPGSSGYRTIAPLCEKAMLEVGGIEDSGLSEDSMREIRSRGRAVEVFYPQPITIPSSLPLNRPDQVFVPLDERFAQSEVAYGGNQGTYWAQGLRIRSAYAQIKAAAANLPPSE